MSLNNIEVPPSNDAKLFSPSKVNSRLFELFPSKVKSAIVTSVALVTAAPTKLPSKLNTSPDVPAVPVRVASVA